MEEKGFWAKRFEDDFLRFKSGFKKPTKWSLLFTLFLKYGFPMELRGISSKEGAIRLIKNKEIFNRLTEEEKGFVSSCLSG
jgi:hypothetical protein